MWYTLWAVRERPGPETEESDMECSFAKLTDGSWGVRMYDERGVDAALQVGTTVTVRTRAGREESVTLGQVDRQPTAASAIFAKAQAAKPARQEREVTVTEPGVYEDGDGNVFVVKPNREKTRLYAKRLIEIDAERATEAGERVKIDFEYAPGAIFGLTPDMKMPLEKAKKLAVRYGRCIVCNRALKAAKSVEDMIGPVCIKSFRAAPVVRDAEQETRDYLIQREEEKATFARLEAAQEMLAYENMMEMEEAMQS